MPKKAVDDDDDINDDDSIYHHEDDPMGDVNPAERKRKVFCKRHFLGQASEREILMFAATRVQIAQNCT